MFLVTGLGSTSPTGNTLLDQPFTQELLATQDRGILLAIRNTYKLPVTAFIMTVNPAGGESLSGGEVRSYFDVHINYKGDAEIAPGALYEVPVAHLLGIGASSLKPRIRAMVFSDGSTWGETTWISKILDMRGRASDELEAVKAILDSATEVASRERISQRNWIFNAESAAPRPH